MITLLQSGNYITAFYFGTIRFYRRAAMIKLNRELNGKILDIGGGGEGIIGRLYTHQVTAIDIRQSELDEAPGDFEKVLMDGNELEIFRWLIRSCDLIFLADVYECKRPGTSDFGGRTCT